MENIMDNKPEIKPLEHSERLALYVFCANAKALRQLARYGDLHYTSVKRKYGLIYVDTENVESVTKKLRELKFVKRVKQSYIGTMNKDFSAAFAETNAELKAIMNVEKTAF